MDETRIQIGVAVLELILKYGLPMAMELIQALDKENITDDDIRALAYRVPHPDAYDEG
jgi:hypothetical protein